MKNKIGSLRLVGNIEGWSYLILLCVAMPLKYFAGMPMAVKIVGMTHGLLFIAFVWVLADASMKHRWSYSFRATAFAASLVPFGTFMLDRRLKRLQHAGA